MSINDGSHMAGAWRVWTLAEWNERLFRHVFERRGADSLHPIVRIPVTPEFLALAAGADAADALLVREHFIRHFQIPRSEFNQLFRQPDISTLPTTELPPFFAKLVLTLLVASACSETADEGDFRKRLAMEVRHLPGTQYHLSSLPLLWRNLQEWLRVNSGAKYRELSLPDPGLRDTIIGYSKGLTFPTYRDYQALIRILDETRLDVEDSPLAIIDAVRSSQSRFTRSFMHAVDEFVVAYSDGLPGTRNHPFWAAVRSIAWERGAGTSEPTKLARYGVHLSLADPLMPIISLLASTIGDSELPRGYRRTILAPPLGHFCFGITSEGVGFQFRSSDLQQFPDFSRSSLAAAIRDGCVCFADDESGERIFHAICPDDPEIYLALDETRSRQVLSTLGQSQLGVVHRSQLEGTTWRLVGPLPGQVLLKLGQQILSTNPILALTPRLAEPSIRLHDSCRVGNSYMLRLGVYPEASCSEADRMDVVSKSVSWPVRFQLERTKSGEQDARRFRFPRDAFELLSPPVEIELVASLNELPIARKTLHVCALVASTDYKEMTDRSAWIVEGNRGHLEEQTPAVCLPEHLYSENPNVKAMVRGVIHPRAVRFWNSASSNDLLGRPDRLSGLVEVISARSIGRQGLAESELISLITNYLSLEPRWLCWDVLRSLVENWQLNAVTARRWGNRKYFAIRPFLCRDDDSGSAWLLGLMPTLKRAELANYCVSLGIDLEFELDPERGMPLGPIRFETLDSLTARRLADNLGVPFRSLDELGLRIPEPFRKIADWSERDRNEDDDGCEQSFWNWSDGHFAYHSEPGDVLLRRRAWQDRPDEYRITIRQSDSSWLTLSRTWALLMAHGLARKRQFWLTEAGDILRAENTQGHLPIEAARVLSMLGGACSGLREGEGETMQYVYSGASKATASTICGSLFDIDGIDDLSVALQRWRGLLPKRGRPRGSTRSTKDAQLAESFR
jgi:hypothetical protein